MPYTPTNTITHSKILSFTCPKRYELLHIQGLRDDSDPARRGSTVHAANELYLGMLVRAGESSNPDFADLALHEAIVRESTPAHLIPDVEYLWRNHVENFELDLEAFLEAEERKVVGEFSFKPDYNYAKVEAFEVHDLKTHYQALTPEGAKKDLQARMYAFLASKVWPGFPKYRFVFHFVRLRQTVVAEFELGELDAIERQLDAHLAAITEAVKSSTFPASPGQQCAYCTFACPAVDDAARMPARIRTLEEAEAIGASLTVLKSAVSQQTRVLEAYTALQGPVVAAGYEWAHRPVEKFDFPAVPVLDILKGVGAPVEKLTFGKTILRSYLTAKKWAHLKPDLEAVAKVTPGTKFQAKKVAMQGDDINEGNPDEETFA